jgi:hypothetical protein
MAYGSFSVTVSFLRSADKRYCGERMVEPGRKWEGREGTGSAMTSQVTHGARRVVLMIDVRPGMYPHCTLSRFNGRVARQAGGECVHRYVKA